MAMKKKEPRLRWKRVKTTWWGIHPYVLQEWSETQNKYIDIQKVI